MAEERRLPNYLRTYRKRCGFSQREIAMLLGTGSGSKVSHYERFLREPALRNALRCEIIFDVPVRELFAGIFEGDADEIPFEAVKTTGFLDSMRELVTEGSGRRAVSSEPSSEPLSERDTHSSPTAHFPQLTAIPTMWHGVAQLLEAMCATLSNDEIVRQLPAEMRGKLCLAAAKIIARLDPTADTD